MNFDIGMLIVIVLIAGVAYYLYKESKKDKAPAVAVSKPFPGVIEGTLDASPMADRVKALAIEAASKGIAITGDYAADVAAQGGEMTLLGYSFKFVFDANGKVVEPESHCNLFGVNYPVDGAMSADGQLGMSIIVEAAKVEVRGQVVGGKFVNGTARKGWLPHIYGVLNGTWRPA